MPMRYYAFLGNPFLHNVIKLQVDLCLNLLTCVQYLHSTWPWFLDGRISILVYIRTCLAPKSQPPHQWSDDITRWPVSII